MSLFIKQSTSVRTDSRVFSLQYQNRKAEYFKAVWDVVNWKAAEKRFKASGTA